jgi:hypothetical protein
MEHYVEVSGELPSSALHFSCRGGSLGPKAGLKSMEKREVSSSCGESNLVSSIFKLIA